MARVDAGSYRRPARGARHSRLRRARRRARSRDGGHAAPTGDRGDDHCPVDDDRRRDDDGTARTTTTDDDDRVATTTTIAATDDIDRDRYRRRRRHRSGGRSGIAPGDGSLSRPKTIAIDPGHDGGNYAHAAEINRPIFIGTQTRACDTTGTQTNDGYSEAAYNLDVALRLQ